MHRRTLPRALLSCDDKKVGKEAAEDLPYGPRTPQTAKRGSEPGCVDYFTSSSLPPFGNPLEIVQKRCRLLKSSKLHGHREPARTLVWRSPSIEGKAAVFIGRCSKNSGDCHASVRTGSQCPVFLTRCDRGNYPYPAEKDLLSKDDHLNSI